MISPLARARSLGLALILATLAIPQGARAHAFLERAVPPVGGTVAVSPEMLHLRFTEAIVAHFSTVQVQDARGQPVRSGSPHTEDDGRTLVVNLPRLSGGTYTVTWHVTADDTHKTEGRFTFTIAP